MIDTANVPNMIYNAQSECAVLAAIMSCDKRTAHIIHDLMPDDFYMPAHREMFCAMREIVARGDEPQLTTMDEELEKRGTLAGIGGAQGLVAVNNAFFMPTVIGQDVETMHRLSARRRLKAISDTLAQKAFDRMTDETEIVLDIMSELRRIKLTNNRWTDMMQIAVATYDQIERVSRGEEVIARTGFPTLDKDFRGFRRGALTVIGARPASGKSAFAAQIARSVSEQGFKVGFFSLEMLGEQYGMRLFASTSGVALDAIQESERLTEDDWHSLADALPKVAGVNMLYVEDAFTIEDIVARAWQMVERAGVDMVIVDHMHLVQTKKRVNSANDRVSHVSVSLKQLAAQLKIPVIAMAQLNRSAKDRGGDKRPILTDLRDSGTIEQDADTVIMLHAFEDDDEKGLPGALYGLVEKERKRKCSIVNVRCIKQRMGPTFETNMHFSGAKMLFTDLGGGVAA